MVTGSVNLIFPRLIPDPINLHGGEQDIAGLTDWIWDQLVSVPNFSWMVVILVRRHVPMLDNGGTGLTDPWSNNRRTRGILLDSSC